MGHDAEAVQLLQFFTVSPERLPTRRQGKPTPDSIREGARRWREEVLPEVLDLTERYRAVDFASMTNEQLVEEIERLPELRFRSGQLHTLAVTPGWTGVQFLIDTYKELTGGTDLEALRLIQGDGDKSFEAGERLWQVAQVAAREPSVKDRLLATDRNTALETLAALRSDPAAAEFIRAFDAYLEEFGWRSAASFGRDLVRGPDNRRRADQVALAGRRLRPERRAAAPRKRARGGDCETP